MSFDVQKVVEEAARAAYDSSQRFNRGSVRAEEWDLIPEYWRRIFRAQATSALAVIVPAVTEQVRALHPGCDRPRHQCGLCHACTVVHPCPTVRLLDEIDAAARADS